MSEDQSHQNTIDVKLQVQLKPTVEDGGLDGLVDGVPGSEPAEQGNEEDREDNEGHQERKAAGSPKGLKSTATIREKIGHRRVMEGGEVTYKKIQSSQIMGSIQLGIHQAVGGLASKPERDLLMQDFLTVETAFFPQEGSSSTTAHHYTPFTFKAYAPIAFRYFRDLFGIQTSDYLVSITGRRLIELSNPGASGSIFYLTEDDEFIIKTVQHKEGEFLQKLLPGYYMNINQNPRTLLPKFFGLYCYQCNSKNIRLLVMNNLLPRDYPMHEKYDLKGSTYKRKASKEERSKKSPTFKDLDFMEIHPEGILLEAETYNALAKTIARDCRVLESFKIMDYSMLVGVHNVTQSKREKNDVQNICGRPHNVKFYYDAENSNFNRNTGFQWPVIILRKAEEDERDFDPSDKSRPPLVRTKSINRQKLIANSTALESIQVDKDEDEENDFPPGAIPAWNAKGDRLALYLGIIDILQSYRLKKKLEHAFKSVFTDGDTVSVHRPSFYAQRFMDFMKNKVFKKITTPLKHSPSKKKAAGRASKAADAAHQAAAAADFSQPGPSRDVTDSKLPRQTSSVTSPTQVTPSANNLVVNLPAVLKDRVPSMRSATGKVPPPVPPRSPKRLATSHVTTVTFSNGLNQENSRPTRFLHMDGLPSGSSTPPPGFQEALDSKESPVTTTDSVVISSYHRRVFMDSVGGSPGSSTASEGLRLRDIMIDADRLTAASSLGSGFLNTTSPTATWTEGTPSFTESSGSEISALSSSVRGVQRYQKVVVLQESQQIELTKL